jgi:hypothetical protein
MPLALTTTQQAAASVLSGLRALRGSYESASRHLDAIFNGLLGLSNDDLAAIGNEMGPEQMTALLTAHAQQVGGCNSLATGTAEIIAALTQSAVTPGRLANAATLEARLAEQYRAIVPDPNTGLLTVIDLPRPEPEPEPQPE